MYYQPMKRKYADNRIRELRLRRGLSMEALALSISPDISLTTIGKLETGRMALSLDWIRDIAKALGVSASEIVDQDHGYRMLPVLGSIAAGNWSEAIELADTWIPVTGDTWNGREFALRVDGDSMNEIAEPGDFAIVDPDQAALQNDKLYAVMSAGAETTFKRFKSDPPQLAPCSRNKDHKPILVGSEPFTVVGRVTKVIRDLR